jgi:hypothetical protein
MLVNNPQSVVAVARMNDSRNCPAGGASQVVEVGRSLLGLDLRRRRIAVIRAGLGGAEMPEFGESSRRRAAGGRLKERRRGLAPGLFGPAAVGPPTG